MIMFLMWLFLSGVMMNCLRNVLLNSCLCCCCCWYVVGCSGMCVCCVWLKKGVCCGV